MEDDNNSLPLHYIHAGLRGLSLFCDCPPFIYGQAGLTPRLQPDSQNVQGGVVVPIHFPATHRTKTGPRGQRDLLPVITGGTGLGCIVRIHLHKLSTPTFSLIPLPAPAKIYGVFGVKQQIQH